MSNTVIGLLVGLTLGIVGVVGIVGAFGGFGAFLLVLVLGVLGLVVGHVLDGQLDVDGLTGRGRSKTRL